MAARSLAARAAQRRSGLPKGRAFTAPAEDLPTSAATETLVSSQTEVKYEPLFQFDCRDRGARAGGVCAGARTRGSGRRGAAHSRRTTLDDPVDGAGDAIRHGPAGRSVEPAG